MRADGHGGKGASAGFSGHELVLTQHRPLVTTTPEPLSWNLGSGIWPTREVLGTDDRDGEGDEWAPHLTLCYSTTEQPAAPVIAALGKTLPAYEVTITEMSLVVQDGPEDLWNWQAAGSARLLGSPGASSG